MNDNTKNPLNMVPDPFLGNNSVFPNTKCTREREFFFARINEIHALLYITKHSYDETTKNYSQIIPTLPFKENTLFRIDLTTGNSAMFPVKKILQLSKNGINILTRQAFVMFYGSFETYLFQLFERSFPEVGITEDILDCSLKIMMRKKWDSKFNSMSEAFDLGFQARELIEHFSGFELDFEGRKHKNPLIFLDELVEIRHRIVHASSIIEKNKLIPVDMNMFHSLQAFYFLLTDFVDSLFANKFSYRRQNLNPAKA